MPKFPQPSARVEDITGSIFEKYAPRIAAQGDEVVRLHIGDTYLLQNRPETNRYCNTFGIEPLRDALAEKLREDNGLPAGCDNILVTCGATNALSVSVMSLVNPGEEALVLSPAWPFLFGMVKLAGGQVTDVPFYIELARRPALDIASYLAQFTSEKTAVICVNTPNNPSGKVLSLEQLRQIADFAEERNLWIISDEAYDGLTFDGRPQISIGSLPGMFERTLSVFTFSKSFMFAGLRLGYVAAAPETIRRLNKMMVHQLYSASTIAQEMMLEPVRTRGDWLPEVRRHYQRLRDIAVETLALEIEKPEAGYFAFFSIHDFLQGRDYWEVVDACIDGGVSIAPGNSFGARYGQHIRICFTGEPEARLRLGIQRLNGILNSTA